MIVCTLLFLSVTLHKQPESKNQNLIDKNQNRLKIIEIASRKYYGQLYKSDVRLIKHHH